MLNFLIFIITVIFSISLTDGRPNELQNDKVGFETSTISEGNEDNDSIYDETRRNPGLFPFFLDSAERNEFDSSRIISVKTAEKNRILEFDVKVREDAYQKTEARENPYSVKLIVVEARTMNSRYISHCSGSLLSLRWVLTAGHCLSVGALGVAVYAGVKVAAEAGRGAQYAESRRWFVHPNFSLSADVHPDFDVALIKLPAPLELTEFVRPIELSTAPWGPGYRGCSVTAFGKVLMNDSRPDDFVRKTHALAVGRPCACGPLLERMVGAAPASRLVCARLGRDFGLCRGDSGGGLVCDGRLAGVASFIASLAAYVRAGACDDGAPVDDLPPFAGSAAVECGDRHSLTVFQDTHPSLAWIEATIIMNGASDIIRTGRVFSLVLASCLLKSAELLSGCLFHR